jgi:HTH-type transcriptional regulator/antitoxin HigA
MRRRTVANRFKVIKTEAEYRAALAQFEAMLEIPEDRRDYDGLELSSLLIEKYENEHHPIAPPDPIEALKFRMEQAGLSKKDLIPYLGSRSRVSEVLSGKRELTLGMIRALNAHLGIPAEALIREPPEPLPTGLADLDFSRFPVREMQRNGAFRGFDSGGQPIADKAEEAVRWLIARAGGFKAVPQFALRKNDELRLRASLDRYALLGWILQALREGRENPVSARFDPGIVTNKFTATLVSLSVTNDSPRQAKNYLGQAGISLIAVPPLEHTHLDGAVFLPDGRQPLIALTLRYDRLDNFWFVLLHELGHIAKCHLSKEDPCIADDLDLPHHGSEQEMTADRYAAQALLPKDFDLDRRESIASAHVIQYAREHGVHPAIVAGRIRHSRKNYRILSRLVGTGEVRQWFCQE